MNKRIVSIISVLLALICVLGDFPLVLAQNSSEILQDGFEIRYWNSSYSIYKDYSVSYNSEFSYCLVADEPNHLRIIKTFEVDKNKQYVISAHFKTEDIVTTGDWKIGANISEEQIWNTSSLTLSGDNDWTEVGLVVNSENNTEVTVSFSLGYFSNLCTGKLYIDNIKCEEMDAKITNTNVSQISNFSHISSLQQFKYMNKGLAYAYAEDNMLNIVTPNNRMQFEMKYPLLGDVISDDNGNFYIVWGEENETSNYDIETVFISKYSERGDHIKTTGFVGQSIMGKSGNTKTPFSFGTCDSFIANGCLMVNYARSMYNGHQSNNVIGVYIGDMSPVTFYNIWDIPYTSHSFNQRVIWSDYISDFVYADQGDAYDRGFIITSASLAKNIFHYYLQANANYNMGIVNKTFAQLGGLLETSSGVVLVGASVKSLSEKAKEEKQNLFVQIFDPKEKSISKSMFVGGIERSGATSFDINDNQNSPLTSVTDYGVHWLTNNIDRDVVTPHSVVADNYIIILWNEESEGVTEAFYIMLTPNGNIVKPATSLGRNIQLNPTEKPIYHDGKVYWASAYNGKITVQNIDVYDEINEAEKLLHISDYPTNQNGSLISSDNISEVERLEFDIENNVEDSKNVVCLVGFYTENGKLISLASKKIKVTNNITPVEMDIENDSKLSEAGSIKIFVWDVLSDLTPVSASKIYKINDQS